MKVLVYVEGRSDQRALEQILSPVLEQARQNGAGIRFLVKGNKELILEEVPLGAARHLAENQQDGVIALPDLYPMAKFDETRHRHRSPGELKSLLLRSFREHAAELRLPGDVQDRFIPHCQKHDLEALLLAAREPLRKRLGTRDQLKGAWRVPVEDQDDELPPKRVVERLFAKYRKKPGYDENVDAPWILHRAKLEEVEAACPQCFAPFVGDLRRLAGTST